MGELAFYKRTGTGLTKLYSSRSEAVHKGNFNTLGLFGAGRRFHLYVNESLLKTVEDSDLASGETGVIALSTGRFCLNDFTIYRRPG